MQSTIIGLLSDGIADLPRRILPVVKANMSNKTFIVCFLNELFAARDDGIDAEAANKVFRDVASDFVQDFQLPTNETPSSHSTSTMNYGSRPFSGPSYPTTGYGGLGYMTSDYLGGNYSGVVYGCMQRQDPAAHGNSKLVESKDLVGLTSNFLSMGLKDEVLQLFAKIESQPKDVIMGAFDALLLPFLSQLPETLHDLNIPLTTEQCQGLYRNTIHHYITRYVQPCPQKPLDWARETVGDGCKDCLELDSFLKSPRVQVGRFQMHVNRRRHLEQKLGSYGSGKSWTYTTDKARSPHTLVVTKNLKAYNAELGAWQERAQHAQSRISAIGRDNMFGQGYTKDIMEGSFAKLVLHEWTPLTTLSQPTKRNAPAQDEPAAKRRHVEIVDLA